MPFELKMKTNTRDSDVVADVYIIMSIAGSSFFWDQWSDTPDFQRRYIKAGQPVDETILAFTRPEGTGSGTAQFYGTATPSGTTTPISNSAAISFRWN